jgi:hypothetical protein
MSLPDTRTMLHLRLTLSCTAWAAVGYIAVTLLFDGPAGFGDEFPSLPIVTIAVGLLVSLVVGTWQWRYYGTGRVRIRRTVLIDAPVAAVLARAAEAATALGASAPRIDEEAGTVDLRVPPSPASLGRRSRVAAVAEGTGSRVTVTCRPLFPLAVTDAGRGADHVARLVDALEPVSA